MEEVSYKEFDLEQFEKTVTNIKLKRFLEYLRKYLKMDNYNSKYILRGVTKKDVINSLNYYITINKVGYQVTAHNYTTYVKKFFKKLSSEYNIKNELFLNNELYDDMFVELREIIEKLNKGETEIAEDETSEELALYIEKEIRELNLNRIWKELKKEFTGKEIRCGAYHNFMSIIPTKLAIEYGLKNEYIHGLKLEDYDKENNQIMVQGFTIPLSEEYKHLFSHYLEMRRFLLEKYGTTYNDLFIKGDSKPITSRIGNPITSTLFFVMDKALKTTGTNQFIYRKILDYIDRGIDIATISKATGISAETCIKLLTYYNEEITKVNINKIFEDAAVESRLEEEEVYMSKRNYMRCPSCGDFVKPSSSNWVIVQYGDKEETYIVCKGCKGVNAKDYM